MADKLVVGRYYQEARGMVVKCTFANDECRYYDGEIVNSLGYELRNGSIYAIDLDPKRFTDVTANWSNKARDLTELEKKKANIIREGLILSLKAKLMDALVNNTYKNGLMSEIGNYCNLGALSCKILEISKASDDDILNNKIDVE